MNEVRPSTGEPVRLRPEMASRRLIVLEFVRSYITQWNGSPSLGEIANGCAISRTRARQLVARLVRDGKLLRKPGPRGLSLPERRDEALRRLRDLGWSIDSELNTITAASPHDSGDPCTNPTLLPPAALDYIPVDDREGNNGLQRKRKRKGKCD